MRVSPVSQRQAHLVWLKDMLENLTAHSQQLEWADDPEIVRVLTETMLRELGRCQRVCEALHRRGLTPQAV